jgi:hypothetical protein
LPDRTLRGAFERALPLDIPHLPLDPSASRQPDDVLGVGEISNVSDPPANARLADSETSLVFVEEPPSTSLETPPDQWMLVILDGFSANGTFKWKYSWVQATADPATGEITPASNGITSASTGEQEAINLFEYYNTSTTVLLGTPVSDEDGAITISHIAVPQPVLTRIIGDVGGLILRAFEAPNPVIDIVCPPE